jgi:uncharacterized membrane protein YsdA (DUF1294 family)
MHQFFQKYTLESFFIAYYLTLNLISFWLYGWDKAAARAKKPASQRKHCMATHSLAVLLVP